MPQVARARCSSSGAQIKQRASDAVIDGGGTITHHHAVGRDHMPWYQRQRPALFGAALAAAKRTLDPAGILNPGVLITASDDRGAGAEAGRSHKVDAESIANPKN